MRPFRLFAAGLAGLALCSCGTVRTPQAGVPTAFGSASGASLSAAALETWWTQFQDPELNRLEDLALTSSPDARSAAARLQEARVTASSALVAFLPQGNIAGSTKETDTTQTSGTRINIPGFSNNGTSNATSANLNVSWEVDLFGRIFAANRAAGGDKAAARFNAEAARASLAANVADVYFQTKGLAIQLQDARQTERIAGDLQRIVEIKLTRGLASQADADRVAGDYAQARSQTEGLKAELTATQRTLLVLVGRGTDVVVPPDGPVSVGLIPSVPAAIPGEILARRPDVREAHARIASQAGRLAYSELAFFPTFSLTPGVGLSRSKQPNFSSATRFWSIGGAVSQPILSIPRLLIDMKAQSARAEQAVIAYEKSVQTAYGEADSALVRFAADHRRVELLTDGESRASRAAEAAKTRYAVGLDDLQTALGAEQSWRAVRSQLTAAQVQALRRAVQTYKALGGGWAASDTPTDKEAR